MEEHRQHSYPPLQGEREDDHTHKRNMELLRQELALGKSAGNSNVKQLMSRTFLHRREWITSSGVPDKDILEEYKILRKIPHVGHSIPNQPKKILTPSDFHEIWHRHGLYQEIFSHQNLANSIDLSLRYDRSKFIRKFYSSYTGLIKWP